MQMIDVMKRLAELDSKNPNIVSPTKPAAKEELVVETITESRRDMALPNMPEPNLLDLRALSGVKKLNESTIAECGMMPMGAPMPSMLPASLNMSAGNAGEIVAMMRGIMDLAKGDVATQTAMPTMGAEMPSMGGMEKQSPLFAEPEKKVSGPTFGSDGPANAEPVDTDDLGGMGDEMGGEEGGLGDELADIVKKIKTGQPVKITTDMPVKVSSDEPIKGRTDQQAKVDDGGDEDEGYDNTPHPQTKGHGGGDDFANIINKVRVADMAKTPSGSGSNPMPDEKEDESQKTPPMETFEAKLMAEYQKFVSEGEKTMSRAAKGYEKYGKKGMKALSDAGKEGKDLEPVRAKYNKYD